MCPLTGYRNLLGCNRSHASDRLRKRIIAAHVPIIAAMASLELPSHSLGWAGRIPSKGKDKMNRASQADFQRSQEASRARLARLLENLIQDLRFGLRQLWKSPGFTVVAILTLALGIGANTAIFTLVHAVMLTSLPVNHPEQLYSLG